MAVLSSGHKHVTCCEESGILLQLCRSPSTNTFCTDRDAFCFSFFRERTGPEFSGFFDSSFWSGLLLQPCVDHTSVRQAAIALGAVHRRLGLGITPEAFEYCDFAFRAYTGAVMSLKRALAKDDPRSLELSVMGSMLFRAFETFQGNYGDACKHMASGLKILFDRKLQRLSTSSSRTFAIFNVDTLIGLFSRLKVQAEELFASSSNWLKQSRIGRPQAYQTSQQSSTPSSKLAMCYLLWCTDAYHSFDATKDTKLLESKTSKIMCHTCSDGAAHMLNISSKTKSRCHCAIRVPPCSSGSIEKRRT